MANKKPRDAVKIIPGYRITRRVVEAVRATGLPQSPFVEKAIIEALERFRVEPLKE